MRRKGQSPKCQEKTENKWRMHSLGRPADGEAMRGERQQSGPCSLRPAGTRGWVCEGQATCIGRGVVWMRGTDWNGGTHRDICGMSQSQWDAALVASHGCGSNYSGPLGGTRLSLALCWEVAPVFPHIDPEWYTSDVPPFISKRLLFKFSKFSKSCSRLCRHVNCSGKYLIPAVSLCVCHDLGKVKWALCCGENEEQMLALMTPLTIALGVMCHLIGLVRPWSLT